MDVPVPLVVPVLTAHPTEVQRQSTQVAMQQIADLLERRDRMTLTAEEQQENDLALQRQVLTLWHTRLVRGERLRVIDEVKNVIGYFRSTFFTSPDSADLIASPDGSCPCETR